MAIRESSIPKGVETHKKTQECCGSELNDLLNALVQELKQYHPIADPGMWDVTTENIRAVRSTIQAYRDQQTKDRLGI